MDVFSHIYLILLEIRDNDKLEIQPFVPLFIMTFIHLVILSVYARHGVCTSNISQMTYCCNYQKKGESHEEGNSQITEDVDSGISEEIRKQQ